MGYGVSYNRYCEMEPAYQYAADEIIALVCVTTHQMRARSPLCMCYIQYTVSPLRIHAAQYAVGTVLEPVFSR